MAGDVDADGVVHAGAQFAARRQELGISQRDLAVRKLISAPALIAFEKGRSWPREKTRATLEELVNWPPGTLARLAANAQASAPDAKVLLTETADDPAELLSGAVALAAQPVFAAVETLPPSDDPTFAEQASRSLADLRQLESLAARAVRTSQGSARVITLLRDTRQCHDRLIARVAASPGATLGQRLYAARIAAALTVEEVAGAAGMTADIVIAAEADQPVSVAAVQQIEALIAELAG